MIPFKMVPILSRIPENRIRVFERKKIVVPDTDYTPENVIHLIIAQALLNFGMRWDRIRTHMDNLKNPNMSIIIKMLAEMDQPIWIKFKPDGSSWISVGQFSFFDPSMIVINIHRILGPIEPLLINIYKRG